MPKFLTTRNVTGTLENIISDSEKRLILLSPYVFIPNNLVDRLKHAVERGVNVVLVTRGDLREPEVKKWEFIGMKVLVNHDLHAKAYCNESEAIVTSFNLIDSSERYNIEFGMSVTKSEDEKLYSKIVSECDLVIRKSVPLAVIGVQEHEKGFCIRCHKSIEQNSLKPYCHECFKIWNGFENHQYIEKFCNKCGKGFATSMEFPLCDTCNF